jgi:hypothetical protein
VKKHTSWQPDATQELLLKAALMPPEAAVDCWQRWQGRTDIEKLDYASFRLLPLLYKNLQSAGVEAAALARYRSVYRHFWYKNKLYLHRLGGFLERYNHSGASPLLLLKGVPLILNYYADPGLRPMADIDILISEDDLQAAFAILQESGWVAEKQLPERPTSLWLLAERECHFRNREGMEIDLHWNLLQESFQGKDEINACIGRGREVSISAGIALVPDATDLFYHVLIHGVRWNSVHPLRWIPDVKVILERDGEQIEWNRIIDMARRDHLVLRLKWAIQYLLVLGMGNLIPSMSRRIIVNLEHEIWEIPEFWFISRRNEIWGDFPGLCFQAYRYSRKSSGWRKRWRAAIGFVLCRWRIRNLYHLPMEVMRRLRRRFIALIKNFQSSFAN